MSRLDTKKNLAIARKRRVRRVVRGTSERPRLHVSISNASIAAQIINDLAGETIVGSKTAQGAVNIDTATKFGTDFAKLAKKKNVSKVVLDRGPKKYHGRLKAFSDAARKEGLDF